MLFLNNFLEQSSSRERTKVLALLNFFLQKTPKQRKQAKLSLENRSRLGRFLVKKTMDRHSVNVELLYMRNISFQILIQYLHFSITLLLLLSHPYYSPPLPVSVFWVLDWDFLNFKGHFCDEKIFVSLENHLNIASRCQRSPFLAFIPTPYHSIKILPKILPKIVDPPRLIWPPPLPV